MKFDNGESFNYPFERNPMKKNGYYATLRTVKLTWNHTDTDEKIAKRIGSVDAGQKAFLHLYDEAWRDPPDKETDVIINLSADNRKLEFYLTDGINRYDIDSELI